MNYDKIIVKGNKIIIPKGKGKDKDILEIALSILHNIFLEKMESKINIKYYKK